MGDRVSIVAFQDVDDVPGALVAAEAVLRDAGIVAGMHDPEAVLVWQRGLVLRPGPKAADATAYGDRVNKLMTNGVAFIGARYFHAYGIGLASWFQCPVCDARVAYGDTAYGDQMGNLGTAAMDWCNGDDAATAACLLCQGASRVTDWAISDPVFLADMAVEFWNWPYLDEDAGRRAKWWHVDVVPMLEAAVGVPAMLSGHKI